MRGHAAHGRVRVLRRVLHAPVPPGAAGLHVGSVPSAAGEPALSLVATPEPRGGLPNISSVEMQTRGQRVRLTRQ